MGEIIRQVKSMIPPYSDLFICYCVLFIAYQLIVIYFKEFITVDLIYYTILLIILILPLFPYINEIKIGFLSITKELDEFKQDVDERLLLLQNTVVTSINQKQQVNIDFGGTARGPRIYDEIVIDNDAIKGAMRE